MTEKPDPSTIIGIDPSGRPVFRQSDTKTVHPLLAWLTQICDEDEARLTGPTFCAPVWPTTDQLLARLSADRQILALHSPEQVSVLRTIVARQWVKETAPGCQYCAQLCHSRSGLGCADDGLDAPWPCDTIRILASAHSSRPGYCEEWRP